MKIINAAFDCFRTQAPGTLPYAKPVGSAFGSVAALFGLEGCNGIATPGDRKRVGCNPSEDARFGGTVRLPRSRRLVDQRSYRRSSSGIPDDQIRPSAGTCLHRAIAAESIWTQQALLAPSLGAAVFGQVLRSDERSAAPCNLAVGHIAGLVGVFLAGPSHARPLIGAHDLPTGRILAAAIAVPRTIVGQMLAQARTPTGGATALVVALGVETAALEGAARLALVMALGEVARRLILRAERR